MRQIRTPGSSCRNRFGLDAIADRGNGRDAAIRLNKHPSSSADWPNLLVKLSESTLRNRDPGRCGASDALIGLMIEGKIVRGRVETWYVPKGRIADNYCICQPSRRLLFYCFCKLLSLAIWRTIDTLLSTRTS